jgi:hypothetical protein
LTEKARAGSTGPPEIDPPGAVGDEPLTPSG